MGRYVVLGLGSFGFYLAKTLYENGQEVIAVDSDENIIEKIKDYVTQSFVADATDKETLSAIGVTDADVVVVSLGPRMEPSILSVLYLRELGVKEIIVKALNEDHKKILEVLGATDVIYPEKDIAVRTAHKIMSGNVIDFLPLAPGYSIQQIAPPPEFVGKSLRELDLRNKYKIQVIAVKEIIPEKLHLIPAGDFVIKESDLLMVVGRDEDIRKLSVQ
ncbi:MAG: TrkA family potassium uptake protein [Candidatus Aminicenantes bacterium]|nr:TrkA family potassium uptake protein [Candidatus Aminicenantes bacterium]